LTLDDALAQLTSLGDEKVRAQNRRNGAGDNQFGVRAGDIRKEDPWAARPGWSLTSGRVARSADGLDLSALLDRIEAELATAVSPVQWTMNACLAGIGIHFPKHRKRAIAIGERSGVYRDYPVSKGCTSPYAPIWINEMVRRQG
jgi:3-methyladenine DNA glycosylase AlkD